MTLDIFSKKKKRMWYRSRRHPAFRVRVDTASPLANVAGAQRWCFLDSKKTDEITSFYRA
jgi:hypothetical protein